MLKYVNPHSYGKNLISDDQILERLPDTVNVWMSSQIWISYHPDVAF